MKSRGYTLAVALTFIGAPVPVYAGDPQEKYEEVSPDEWKYEFQDGGYVLKEERMGREYKFESKRGNRETKYEYKADGSWKEEVKVGNCTMKREHDSNGLYKSERSC